MDDLTLTPAEETAEYARRIHWWVRLFGVVWLISLVCSLFVAVAILSRIYSEGTRAQGGTSTYDACIAGGYTPTYCLQNN